MPTSRSSTGVAGGCIAELPRLRLGCARPDRSNAPITPSAKPQSARAVALSVSQSRQPQHAPAASHPSRATRSSVPRGAFRADPHTSHRSTKSWRAQRASGARAATKSTPKLAPATTALTPGPSRCDEPPHAPAGCRARPAIAPFAPDRIGPYSKRSFEELANDRSRRYRRAVL